MRLSCRGKKKTTAWRLARQLVSMLINGYLISKMYVV